jgi:hypothetical protein
MKQFQFHQMVRNEKSKRRNRMKTKRNKYDESNTHLSYKYSDSLRDLKYKGVSYE